MIITAGRVVTPARVFAPGWVHVEGEHVTDVGSDAPPRPADVELQGTTVVPGYVDAHVHGGGGASFDTGTAEAAETVAAVHLAHGTTTIMASLVTDTTAELDRSVRELAKLAAAGTLAGIHLEGPWLSPKHSGAHDPALLADPSPRSATRTRRTTWPARRWTRVPGSEPICSTRCAGCTTASPDPAPRCSSTRTPTSS